jgi:hypothetical protein
VRQLPPDDAPEVGAITTRQACPDALSGCNTQELLQALASDEPSSAYLHVAQIPAAHLVIQEVPGEPGQLSRLTDRVSQSFGSQI